MVRYGVAQAENSATLGSREGKGYAKRKDPTSERKKMWRSGEQREINKRSRSHFSADTVENRASAREGVGQVTAT